MKILIIVAHPDDEVLGMGGTILKHSKNGDNVTITYLTTGITARRSLDYNNSSSYNFSKKDLKQNEKQILELVTNMNKKSKPIFRIGEQLDNCFIKIFADISPILLGKVKNCQLLLKISGIWSNEKKHGLTFRFYIVNELL